jgi:LPXTG-site transpeptidase (sortase) family protein
MDNQLETTETQVTQTDGKSAQVQNADQVSTSETVVQKSGKDWRKITSNILMATGGLTLVGFGINYFIQRGANQQEAQNALEYYNRINASPTATVQYQTSLPESQTTAWATAMPSPDALRRGTPNPAVAAEATKLPTAIANATETIEIPDKPALSMIAIAALGIEDKEVVPAGVKLVKQPDGRKVAEWEVPEDGQTIGHRFDSADPGEGGNVVLWAHNGQNPEKYIVGKADQLKDGDVTTLTNEAGEKFYYKVAKRYFINALNPSPDDIANGIIAIGPSDTEKVTLVTCWPKVDLPNAPKWSKRLIIESVPMTPEEIRLFQESQK